MPAARVLGIFPGERPGKTDARKKVFDTFFRALGPHRFRDSNHLVLGGAGGDIEALRSLGVPERKIFVVDHEERCIEKLSRAFPRCRFLHADLVDAAAFLAKDGVQFGTIFIDLCSNLCRRVITLVSATLQTLLSKSTCSAITIRADREMELEMQAAIVRAGWAVPASDFSSMHKRAVALDALLKVRAPMFRGWGCYSYLSSGPSVRANHVNSSMTVLIGGGESLRSPWGAWKFFAHQPLQQERQTTMKLKKEDLEPHSKEDGARLRKRYRALGIPLNTFHKELGRSDGYISHLAEGANKFRSKSAWAKLDELLSALEAEKAGEKRPQENKLDKQVISPATKAHVEAVCAKLRDLRDRGVSLREISRASKVAPVTIRHIMAREIAQEKTIAKLNAGILRLQPETSGTRVPAERKKSKRNRVVKITHHSHHANNPNDSDFQFELIRLQKITELRMRAKTPEQKKQVALLLAQ